MHYARADLFKWDLTLRSRTDSASSTIPTLYCINQILHLPIFVRFRLAVYFVCNAHCCGPSPLLRHRPEGSAEILCPEVLLWSICNGRGWDHHSGRFHRWHHRRDSGEVARGEAGGSPTWHCITPTDLLLHCTTLADITQHYITLTDITLDCIIRLIGITHHHADQHYTDRH